MYLPESYVVTKRPAGLGDLLVSLGSAWWYAKHTKRQLVIDWRNSTYFKEEHRNLLPEILETPQIIDNVILHGDVSKLQTVKNNEFYPKFWNSKNVHKMTWETPELRQNQVDLIKKLRDKKERVVVFSECLPNIIPDKNQESVFFNNLKFNAAIVQAADQFAAANFGNKFLIGLHIRHGNGGNIMGHAPFWTDDKHSLSICCDLLKKCIALCHKQPNAIFLATDSILVEQTILRLFPKTIVYPKKHRKPGDGEIHRGNADPNALKDSLIEMLLLAKSRLLIRFPPSSFFSHFASLIKPNSGLYSRELIKFCESTYSPQIVF